MRETHMGESVLGGGITRLPQKNGKFAESVSGRQDSPLESYTKRYESLSRSGSQNNNKMISYINSPRVSPSPKEVTMKPPMQLKQPSETSIVQNRKAGKGTSRYNSSMPSESMGSTVSSVGGGLGKKSSQIPRLKNRHDQIMMRPVLLDDRKPSQRTRTHKMSHVGYWKKIMPRQQLSEEENSSLSSVENESSSSMWTSKQTESSASSNSNYSMESWSPRNDDFFETESNSQESISSSYPSLEEDRSSLTDSVESDYSHRIYPEKSIGTLRKIKNRLGLIFHHHHHHHHDHANDHSTWKKIQKLFCHKDIRKSVAVKKKYQGGNFHALVKGLMTHVKHSKKSNCGIKPPQPHGLNKKKVVNKLPWWQPFRRGGVKLPKRGRVKVGFANKRPKLQMKR